MKRTIKRAMAIAMVATLFAGSATLYDNTEIVEAKATAAAIETSNIVEFAQALTPCFIDDMSGVYIVIKQHIGAGRKSGRTRKVVNKKTK